MSRACEDNLEEEEEEEEEGLTVEGEEEGMVEELEAQDPGVERRSAGQTDLTLDQKTFLITQKSLKATYKDIVRRWPDRFTREPPNRSTLSRVLNRAREENSADTKKSLPSMHRKGWSFAGS